MTRRGWLLALLLVAAASRAGRGRSRRAARTSSVPTTSSPTGRSRSRPAGSSTRLTSSPRARTASSSDRRAHRPCPEPPAGGRGRGAPAPGLFNQNIPGAKLDHFLAVLDRNGNLIEEWKQWLPNFTVPHRITMDPYDPQRHIWFVDRGSQQIFKFTNDGKQLVMTLGEKGVAGNDEKHFGRPTDIAFLPDGTFFVSDGYDNTRVVKFDKNGKFLMTWGTPGTGPGQFNLPHSHRRRRASPRVRRRSRQPPHPDLRRERQVPRRMAATSRSRTTSRSRRTSSCGSSTARRAASRSTT